MPKGSPRETGLCVCAGFGVLASKKIPKMVWILQKSLGLRE